MSRLRKAESVEYSPELIYTYMMSCIIDDKGSPRFLTHLFGVPLEEGTAILTCRDVDEKDLLVSLYIKQIPKEIYNIIAERGPHKPAEWKKVLAAILTPDFIPKLQEKLGRRRFSTDDIKRMIQISIAVKTKKIPKEKALEYLERIMGPETFYDLLDEI